MLGDGRATVVLGCEPVNTFHLFHIFRKVSPTFKLKIDRGDLVKRLEGEFDV